MVAGLCPAGTGQSPVATQEQAASKIELCGGETGASPAHHEGKPDELAPFE
jgi:hypothetical protein